MRSGPCRTWQGKSFREERRHADEEKGKEKSNEALSAAHTHGPYSSSVSAKAETFLLWGLASVRLHLKGAASELRTGQQSCCSATPVVLETRKRDCRARWIFCPGE